MSQNENMKTYLQQIWRLNTLIDRKRAQLASLKEYRYKITVAYEGERVSSSSNKQRAQDVSAKYLDLENDILKDVEKLADLKREIMSTIDRLDSPEEIELLYRRYVECEKWEKIAYKMHYSMRGIHKVHGRALRKLSEMCAKIH